MVNAVAVEERLSVTEGSAEIEAVSQLDPRAWFSPGDSFAESRADHVGGRVVVWPDLARAGPVDAGGIAAGPIPQPGLLAGIIRAGGPHRETARRPDRCAAGGGVGGLAAGIWLSLVPAWLVGSFANSAELIDPGGPIARRWRIVLVVVTVLSLLHIALCCVRGGRARLFLWPFGHPFWLVRRLREGGLYTEARDRLWSFVASLRVPSTSAWAWLVSWAPYVGSPCRRSSLRPPVDFRSWVCSEH